MKTALSYVALTIAFAFLASGVVMSAFIDVYALVGLRILWLLVPVTLLFMTAVLIDVRYAIPRLLLRQRYLLYCLLIAGISYAASIGAIFMECAVRWVFDFPPRVTDIGSPWVFIDAFSDSILLILVLLGIGARLLYIKWIREADKEKQTADRLSAYMSEVRLRLNPEYIGNSLSAISDSLRNKSSDVTGLIRSLSAYLRNQLYEMPAPSVPSDFEDIRPDYSSLTNFFVGKKYRWLRHAVFQLVLLVISFGTNFNSPDNPDFANKFGGFIVMYVFLNMLTYVNVLWLFHRFKRHRSLKKYMTEVGVLLLAIIIPLIYAEIATYDQNPYDKQLPVFIMVIMTIGTMLTLFFFVGGTAAIMMHQDWIIGKRRITLLHAETVRQEYAFLKKQINPHFLFNVLNNIGILSVDEPEAASAMLSELQKLVEYQFAETDNNTTTLSREIDFLNSYLALEGTRIEPFSYEIGYDGIINDVEIPTLLFIPFVENAVKHSSAVDGIRNVNVLFTVQNNALVFKCENTYKLRKVTPNSPGGLGISNTLRRLNLLFGDNYTYSRRIIDNRYIVTIAIPLS